MRALTRTSVSTWALLIGTALAVMAMTGQAHAYDRQFCMIGGGYPYPGDCSYDTYAACKATASGQQAYCDVNPRFLFNPGAKPRRDGVNLSPLIFQGRVD